MHLVIRGRNLNISDALADHCLKKLFKVARRFQGRVGEVLVRLTDVNGPRGGVDKRCQLVIELPGVRQLIITTTDSDPYCAIDRAANRAKYSIARALKRWQRRGGHRLGAPESLNAEDDSAVLPLEEQKGATRLGVPQE
jgi:ribosome hibernation promoting factor